MKINLEISDGTLFKSFYVCNKKPAGLVNFCIDTGSPDSFISYSDASRLNLKVGHLKKDEILSYAGGGALHLKKLGDLKLIFKTKAGRRETIPIQNMKVCDITKLYSVSEKNRRRMSFLESILGTKFLTEIEADLFVNFSKNIAYLEIPDKN